MMVADNEKETKYEIVDTAELVLYKGKNTKYSQEVSELIQDLRTLPSGKSLRRKFTDMPEQRGFATSLKKKLEKLGIGRDFVVVSPKEAVDHLFLVFVGRKSEVE